MTDTPLTYQSDETAAKADFTITQEFTRENIELKTYIQMLILMMIFLILMLRQMQRQEML